ncbi:STAS domain-containing protein [Paractinoplanes rishiriensis]|uniref:STAS domain-containing protein n=1 Tax=Paractinoplanes rishiriensis TaxID=1050105 RepID=A0A919MWL7_9ACTN|nr:STAS domain-containing protein [Actinoplanes rishiriensis]GIE97599.1 hypothetical protein Ari01nite_50640 [Actinoplanes rishiriensis]
MSGAPPSDDAFSLVTSGARTTRVQPGGEFDRDNRHLLADAVRTALADGWTTVLIDCGRLTFIDASVVHVLLAERRRAADLGRTLRLVNVHGSPGRVLRATGTMAVLCGPGAPATARATSPVERINRTVAAGRDG